MCKVIESMQYLPAVRLSNVKYVIKLVTAPQHVPAGLHRFHVSCVQGVVTPPCNAPLCTHRPSPSSSRHHAETKETCNATIVVGMATSHVNVDSRIVHSTGHSIMTHKMYTRETTWAQPTTTTRSRSTNWSWANAATIG